VVAIWRCLRDFQIIGIELINDIYQPSNYIEIDHHGANSGKASSLEQIAILLDIKLSNRQKFIAANDSGYIKAMKNLNFKDEELIAIIDEFKLKVGNNYDDNKNIIIKEIRRKDREAQGVTKEDEELAEKSILDKTEENGFVIINSLTDKFSPITDTLYPYEKIIIYNDKTLCYYGLNAESLKKDFAEELKENKAYYGGGCNGFFGFADKKFTKEKILKIKDKIVDKEKQLYSYHSFLYPFRWEINKKIDIVKFNDAMKKANWSYEPFEIKDYKDYNEFVYFYEYARDAIYNTDKEFKKNQTVYHYNYSLGDKSYYRIKLKNRENPYELKIIAISLKLYETGVAILSYQMENYKYSCKEDIKKINDFGRRTYPQFLPLDAVEGSLLPAVKGSLLPDWIEIDLDKGKESLKDDFIFYTKKSGYDIKNNQSPADLPRFISGLLGKDFSNKKGDKKIFVDPIIDDRMFTLCWYGNNEEIEKLQKFDVEKNEYTFCRSSFWHEYVFVDGGWSTCQSKTMLPDLLKKHTYDRWIDYGTLWGVSRYSLMAFTTDLPTLKENNAEFIINHIQTMYHQLAVLTLAQRASILNFSKRVTEISKLTHSGASISNDVGKLHKDYIRFVNKIYFSEVTAQEQGIELYDMMLTHMRIRENIKDLDGEIKELHDFAELESSKNNNNLLNFITIIGALFIIPTFATGFFGMNLKSMNDGVFNNFSDWWKYKDVWKWLFMYFSIPASICLLVYAFWKFKSLNKSSESLNFFLLCLSKYLLIFILISIIILFPIYIQSHIPN